ncbi:Transcription initiation factor TFIID subunit 9 [Candida viswanathii]|uniref:Transcription initiation factor TFIID subunit 9 n=1 Tax=Candida viswanathii TaxID=5486 RepID=A0A367Y3N2_9ASCO|nr:Transcription initiation factor TFIID subunit 9 [Candida viswanathii]
MSAEPSENNHNTSTASGDQKSDSQQPSTANTVATSTNSSSNNNNNNNNNQTQPTTSTQLPQEKKEKIIPRDVRLLHLIFATHAVHNYQDHVPLQLMDFAHRYTKSVLKDALVYNDHSKPVNTNTNLNTNSNTTVNTDDIRLAIAARSNYQFKPVPPKELLLELAQERNSKPLPPVIPRWGLNLPPEKYCLTAKDWDSIYDEPDEDNPGQQQSLQKSKKLRTK